MFLYINYPSWIHPEIFPGLPILGLVRWYGLMYIFAFATAYFILKRLLKEGFFTLENRSITEDDIFSYISTGIVFLLIGARIFSTLVYDTSGLYWRKPWLIFWPFDEVSHKFTGLAGMSYHGGFIGGLIGCIFWCKKNKVPVLKFMDAMVLAIPAGYTFGRLGNFLNGELFGRITTAPWGMVFPSAQRFSISLSWVQAVLTKINMSVPEGAKLVNLPRHPSQLYEALFEGLVTFAILWTVYKTKKKRADGFITALYPICYGVFRFVIEYFREPDVDIGYRFSVQKGALTYMNTSLLNLSTGQLLCALMILFGLGLMIFSLLSSKKQTAKATKAE